MLPADGTEPGSAYFDVGSGPNMPSSSEWPVDVPHRLPCGGRGRGEAGRVQHASVVPAAAPPGMTLVAETGRPAVTEPDRLGRSALRQLGPDERRR